MSTQRGVVTADVADAESSEPQTAVVLFSDGQHNWGPSPLQTARVLGSQGIAFYCISMGASRSAPDLAVIRLEHPPMVFQKDRVRGVMVAARSNARRATVCGSDSIRDGSSLAATVADAKRKGTEN